MSMRQARRAFRRARLSDVSFRTWARSKRLQTTASPKLRKIMSL